MAINAAGAVSTGVTLVVVLVSKFLEGAWIMILLIPGLLFLFYSVRAHYRKVGREVATDLPLDALGLQPPVVLLPIRGWSAITRKALRFALSISHEIYTLHIAGDEQMMVALEEGWERLVREPARQASVPAPKLIIVYSPFRQMYKPLIEVVVGPEESPSGSRHRRDHSRADRDPVVPLRAAQPDGRRHGGVPAIERVPEGRRDQCAVVSFGVETSTDNSAALMNGRPSTSLKPRSCT